MSSQCTDGQRRTDDSSEPETVVIPTRAEEEWLHVQWRKRYPNELMVELGRWHAQMANLIKQSEIRWDGKIMIDGEEVCALHERNRLQTALKLIREDLDRFDRFTYQRERGVTGMEGEKLERSVGTTSSRSQRSHSPADLPKIPDVYSVGTIGTPRDGSDSPSDLPKVTGPESVNIFSTTDSPPDLPEIFDQAWISFDQASTAGTSREAADEEPMRPNTPAEQPGSSIWGVLPGIFQVRPS